MNESKVWRINLLFGKDPRVDRFQLCKCHKIIGLEKKVHEHASGEYRLLLEEHQRLQPLQDDPSRRNYLNEWKAMLEAASDMCHNDFVWARHSLGDGGDRWPHLGQAKGKWEPCKIQDCRDVGIASVRCCELREIPTRVFRNHTDFFATLEKRFHGGYPLEQIHEPQCLIQETFTIWREINMRNS